MLGLLLNLTLLLVLVQSLLFATSTRQCQESNNTDDWTQWICLLGHLSITTKWKISYLFGCWLCISSCDVLHLWTLVHLVYLIWYKHRWKQLRCKLNVQRLSEEYTTFLFRVVYIYGLQHQQDRDESNKSDDSTRMIYLIGYFQDCH